MARTVLRYCSACRSEVLTPEDPVAAMAAFPTELDLLVKGLSAGELESRPRPGEWSAKEVVAHLAETEVAFGWRVRTMLADNEPTLAPYNQNDWAAALIYEGYDVQRALRLFKVLREAHCTLLMTIATEAWERRGRHPERGEINVRELVDHRAHHDLQHLVKLREKIERLRGNEQVP